MLGFEQVWLRRKFKCCLQHLTNIRINIKFMKQVLFYFTLSIMVSIVGCKTNDMSGVYVCDQSQKKADTTINHGNSVDESMDLTCTIQALDFKGDSTVELKMKNGPIVTSYIIDKDYIRIKGSGADILFKVKDNKTLIGEGIFEGLYHKK
jgi:hypothetical protein